MRVLATDWVESPPVELRPTKQSTSPFLFCHNSFHFWSAFSLALKAASEAASPEVEPAEFGLGSECPRELGDLG